MTNKTFLGFCSSLKQDKRMGGAAIALIFALLLAVGLLTLPTGSTAVDTTSGDEIGRNASEMLTQGRQIFRYDTFGDEIF